MSFRIYMLMAFAVGAAAQDPQRPGTSWDVMNPTPDPYQSSHLDAYYGDLRGDDIDGWTRNNPEFPSRVLQNRNLENVDTPKQPAGPAGTISVAELRHTISRKGVKLLKKAESDLRAGKHDKVIEDLKLALEERSAEPYAHSMLGMEYLVLGKARAALPELTAAVQVLPIAANHSNLAYALWLTGGDTEECLSQITQAMQLDPMSAQSHYVKGLILLDKHEYDHGTLRELQIASRDVRSAHLALAVYYRAAGQEEAAGQQLEEFLGPERAGELPRARRWLEYAFTEPHLSVALGMQNE
jgi:tetratricopeptide (TPR) repeat protein